ncbi:TRAP transporter substrate-binding protein [Rhodospirillum centenum]|uniref:Bacterial extracellular solute-binding protein, family 7, putative n=1 Tax=Rhodospirillum centenum (strain ATCC 51521 / SW) TaxID=414684 RepID=B6ITB8_RHOCS|nr:TRAP transporter substrate-binding protein [Rhodospirillum centenum]ACI99136.1 bacterial extracellular solute-binding protein, family 7, putative [Rhodospirillum centenum SW]
MSEEQPNKGTAGITAGSRAGTKTGRSSRRRFLGAAAGAVAGTAVGAVAMPNVSRAQSTTLRFQSTWPARDIFHEFAQDYAAKVNALSGGRLKLDLLPAGAVVGALQLQDAIIAGALDGGHSVTAYWYGKHPAFSLFGTPPAWGWRANQMLGWVKYGGGQELYTELLQDVLKLDLVGFLYGPMPTQPLGWFKKEITSIEDMKGLKYRTVGLAADLYKELGVAVTIMGGGDIVPAMDRGLLDGAEFNNPSSDRALGFPDVSKVYMLGSYHQAAESFEVIFNRTKFQALPKELQTVLQAASEAASADMSWKAMDRYSRDLEAMKAAGVKVYKTPESVLKAQLAAWDKVIEEKSKDAFFKKVLDSQRDFARRVVAFEQEYEVRQDLAFQHFFG